MSKYDEMMKIVQGNGGSAKASASTGVSGQDSGASKYNQMMAVVKGQATTAQTQTRAPQTWQEAAQTARWQQETQLARKQREAQGSAALGQQVENTREEQTDPSSALRAPSPEGEGKEDGGFSEWLRRLGENPTVQLIGNAAQQAQQAATGAWISPAQQREQAERSAALAQQVDASSREARKKRAQERAAEQREIQTWIDEIETPDVDTLRQEMASLSAGMLDGTIPPGEIYDAQARLTELQAQIAAADREASAADRDLERRGDILKGTIRGIGSSLLGAGAAAINFYSDLAAQQLPGNGEYLANTILGNDPAAEYAQHRGATSAEIDAAMQPIYDTAAKLGASGQADIEKAKAGLNKIGQFGVDIAQNLLQMGFDMGASALTGGLSTLAVMGTRVFGQSVLDARARGADLFQQVGYGLTNAGIEAFTEKVFGVLNIAYGKGVADDTVEILVKKLAKTPLGMTAMRLAVGSLGEGLEEGMSEVLSPFAEQILTSDALKTFFARWGDPELRAEAMYEMLCGGAVGLLGGVTGIATGQNAALNAEAMEEQDGGTGVNTDPEEHTAAQQAVIEEYRDAVDEGLADYVRSVQENGAQGVKPYELSPVSERAAADILRLTGVDVTGNATRIEPRMIEHNKKAGSTQTANADATATRSTSETKNVQLPDDSTIAQPGRKSKEKSQGISESGFGQTQEREPEIDRAGAEAVKRGGETAMLPDGSEGRVAGAEYDRESGETLLRIETDEEGRQSRLVPLREAEVSEELESVLGVLGDVLGPEQAAHAYNMMDSGQRAGDYARAYGLVRNVFGRNGANLERARASSLGRALTDAQFEHAYLAGQQMAGALGKEGAEDRNASSGQKERDAEGRVPYGERRQGTVSFEGVTLDGVRYGAVTERIDRADVKAVRAIAEATGINVVFYQSEADANGRYQGGNGFYRDGTVYLDIHAGQNSKGESLSRRTLLFTMSHEVTHLIQENAPAQYAKLRQFVTDYLVEQEGVRFQELVEQKQARDHSGRMSYDEAVDEVVADACERMLVNSEAVQEMARTRPKLFETVRRYVRRFLDRLARHEEAKAMEPVLNELRAIWDEGLREAVSSNEPGVKQRNVHESGKNARYEISHDESESSKNTTRKSGVKYQARGVDKYYERQIDRWDGKDHGGAFRVGNVSEALLKVGVPGVDIWFDQSKAAKQLAEKEEITKEELKQIPRLLEEPIAIAESYDNTVLVFGELFDKNGHPIVVAVRINSTNRRNHISVVNKIRSVGTRTTNLNKLLAEDLILYLDENKKRTKSWFNALGRSTPFGGTRFGLIRSIDYSGQNSNTKFSDRDISATDRELLVEAAGRKDAGKAVKDYAKAVKRLETLEERSESLEEELNAAQERAGRQPSVEEAVQRAEETNRALGEAEEALKKAREAFTPERERDAAYGEKYARALKAELEKAERRYQQAKEKHDAAFKSIQNPARAAQDIAEIKKKLKKTEKELKEARNAVEAMEAGKAIRDAADKARESWWNEDAAEGLRQNRRLREDNRRLQRTLDWYREQARGNEETRRRVRRDDIEQLAKTLLDENRSHLERGYLEEQLQEMGDALVSGDGLNAGALNQKAQALAERLLQDADMAGYTEEYTRLVQNEILDRLMSGDVREADSKLTQARRERDEARQELKQERESREEEVRRRVERLRDREQASRERQAKIQSIRKTQKRLNRFLTENSAKRHIPEGMKADIGRFLTTLNTLGPFADEQKAQDYFDELDELRQIVDKQGRWLDGEDEDAGWNGMLLDLPGDLAERMQEHLNSVKKAAKADRRWNIGKMGLEELRELDEILTVLNTAVTNANILLTDAGSFREVGEMAETTIREQSGIRARKSVSAVGRGIEKHIFWANTTPYYYFKRLGSGGQAVFKALTKGWGKLAMNARAVEEFAKSAYTAKEVKDWEKATHDFSLRIRLADQSAEQIEGSESEKETVTMTEAQIMELWCLMRREQAQGHILGAGIKIEAFKNGKGRIREDAKTYLVTLEDLAAMFETLTERQKEVCRALQGYMNTVGSDWGNEISLKRYGIRAYTEENYWPIRTDSNSRDARTPDSDRGNLYRLLTQSFTKNTVKNANNAIVLGSVFDDYANHMADMAKYNALALPMLDALRWYNYRAQSGSNESGQYTSRSVRQAVESAWGKEALSYFQTLMQDLNGNSEGGRGDGFLQKAAGANKVASVGANVRVALQQPTSIVRASLLMDGSYLARGAAQKGGIEKALKWSGLANWKDMGYFDVNINRGLREQIKHADNWKDTAVEKSMFLAEQGDRMTWGALWNACEIETAEKNPALTGEELMEKTAERFDELIMATQVMDSTLTRSHNMRGKGLLSEFTAFMAEPTLTFNTLMDVGFAIDAEARRTDAKTAAKKCAPMAFKAATTFVLSQAVAAIAQSLGDLLRDDDEYAPWYEVFWRHYKENFLDNLDPLQMIPVVKDLENILLRGERKDMMSTLTAQKLFEAGAIWKETIQLAKGTLDKPTKTTWYGNMTGYGKLYKSLDALSRLAGMPAAAAMRDVVSVWNKTAGLLKPEWKLKTYDPGEEREIQYAVQDGYLSQDEARLLLVDKGLMSDRDASRAVYKWMQDGSAFNKVKAAALADDESAYAEARRELKGGGYLDSEVYSQVRGAIKDRYQGTGTDGMKLSKAEAIRLVQEYGNYSREDAEAAVQEWTCFVVTGIAYDKIGMKLLDREITESRAAQLWKDYGGMDSEKAKGKAEWTLYEDIHPETALELSSYQTWYSKYRGLLSDEQYDDYYAAMKNCKGVDENGDGKTDSGSVKEQKLKVIDELPISSAKKDEIYFLNNWAESGLKDAPWH